MVKQTKPQSGKCDSSTKYYYNEERYVANNMTDICFHTYSFLQLIILITYKINDNGGTPYGLMKIAQMPSHRAVSEINQLKNIMR